MVKFAVKNFFGKDFEIKMSENKEKKPSVWSKYTDSDKIELEKLNAGYINFLSTCKTERESVSFAVKELSLIHI